VYRWISVLTYAIRLLLYSSLLPSSEDSGPHLLGALDDFDEAPALLFAERACFHDANCIAHVRVIILVVSHQFGRLFDELAIDRMFDLSSDRDGDAFIHLVANDGPDALFTY